jgi:S1-C subfamily serine protease
VILKLDSTPIDDDAHLVNLVGLIEARKKASLQIYRDGKTFTIPAVVADRTKFGQ